MTPVMKWLRKQVETHLGTFREGPQPPPRFRKLVEVFATANPRASVGDWIEFAALHAEGAYQDGYTRGYERSERLGPDWDDPRDAVAVLEQLDAIASGQTDGFDPSAVVPVDGVPQEHASRAVLALNEHYAAEQGQRRGPRR